MSNQTPAEALRLIKELLKGAIFATYDIVDLDADPSGNTVIPGVSLDEGFEQQWKFIEPKLTAYAATVEREAAIKAVKHLVDHYKDNASYGYGDSGQWMVDAEEYLAALQGPPDGSDGLSEPAKS